tara:strand:- start:561 stop:1544 length:984 start_codon:yes stop_codon:yes gene_type:complete
MLSKKEIAMSENNSGSYQHFLGNPIAKPPCRMLNARMYGFFIEGKYDTITNFVDSTLNSVSTNDVYFKPLSQYCLLTFTDIENIASKVEPFSQYGWMQETDIIVWLPIAKVDKSTKKALHIYWYPAFITVNNINALVNGRETWGYNKYLCRYSMPSDYKQADNFTLSLETFQPFNPTTKMDWHELLTIKRFSDGDSLFEEIIEVGQEVAELIHASIEEIQISAELIKQFMSGIKNPQMDQILFKQIPDGFAYNSVYSAVVHSPSTVRKVHKIAMLKDEYHVNINKLDAFPFDQMFGIKIGQQKALLPYYVCMDFDQDGAYEIVSNNS